MEVLGLTRSLLNDLRAQIVSGEFAPGQKINEIQLTTDLGISRGPLREALRILENECLVVYSPRKGTFVTAMSLEDLAEVFQSREMIESYVIDILKEKGIRELPLVKSTLETALAERVPTPNSSTAEKLAFIQANGGFHIKLVESAGNSRLVQYYSVISGNLARYKFRYSDLQLMTPEQEEDHRRILEAVNTGSYQEAKDCLVRHIRSVGDAIRVRIETGPLMIQSRSNYGPPEGGHFTGPSLDRGR